MLAWCGSEPLEVKAAGYGCRSVAGPARVRVWGWVPVDGGAGVFGRLQILWRRGWLRTQA